MKLEDKLKTLGRLSIPSGTFNKRFARNVSTTKPEAVTDKQKIWIDKILYRYRKQFCDKTLIKYSEEQFINFLNAQTTTNKS